MNTNAQTALDDYVQKPDPNYAWEVFNEDKGLFADVFVLKLTSQQWRSAAEVDRPIWEHELMIFVPEFALCESLNSSPETAILVIGGGRNPFDGDLDGTEIDLAKTLALSQCSVTAVIKQVPNQALNFSDEFGLRPRREDEIIAYTFNKFLETGDPEWPVLLPMTKSAVRAMDAVQEFSEQTIDGVDIKDFIVMGGSKRGWTTWLTAAVDPRVKAILPISIDLLNLDEQFVHHWEAYGAYAPAVQDYVEFDLPCRALSEPRGQALLDIVDPYSYRDRYTMAKLVINSAGDQFFVSDSSQFYFDSLPEPKWLRYTANTDHSQGETEDLIDLFLGARSWIDDINDGVEPPRFSWSFQSDGAIRVQVVDTPERVRLWQAHNPHARDFRLQTLGAVWTSSALQDTGGGVYVGFVPPPAQGFTAFFVEVEFAEGAVLESNQVFTTDVRITPEALPFAGTACRDFPNFTNLWWNPNLPGQALQIVQQGERIAGAWYLYDQSGQAMWTTFLQSLSGNATSGSLFTFTGPALGMAFDPGQVRMSVAGDMSLQFRSSHSATLHYTLQGVPGRQELVPFERLAEPPHTGVWYDPAKNGQGVQLIKRGSHLAGAWYLYGDTGDDLWLSFSGQLQGGVLEADLLHFTGPGLGTVWDEEAVTFASVGTVRVALLSPTAVAFQYTIDGVSGRLDLQPFTP